jgi:hypothetical protein
LKPEPAFSQAVFRFGAQLDREKRLEFAAALRQCVDDDRWKSLPYPHLPGTLGAKFGGYFFVAVRREDGVLYVKQVAVPMTLDDFLM